MKEKWYYLKTKDVSELLWVCEQTVREMIKKWILKGRKGWVWGKTSPMEVHMAEVEKYLSNND